METIFVKHNSEDWLNFRTQGIGGSEAAAILGQNPYKNNIELWQEKTGLSTPKEISNIKCVEYGKSAEEFLTALFALDFPEYEVIDTKDRVYKKDFMFASLDGELIRKSDGAKGVLEIKTSELFSSSDFNNWKDQIPNNYYIQILHYLLVTDYKFAILKAQLKSVKQNGDITLQTKHYFIDACEAKNDIQYLYEEERKFWNYVEKREQPPRRLAEI